MASFFTKIEIINGNPYVTPPKEVLESIFRQAGKDRGTIPVRGTLNGAQFQQTLVRYMGDWRLYINGVMSKKAGLKFTGSITAIVGMRVEIEVGFDSKPPEYKMNPKLKSALDKDKKAKASFEALTWGRRKEILRYLGFMKTEASLLRNIERVMQHLRGEKSDAMYPLMHRKQKKT